MNPNGKEHLILELQQRILKADNPNNRLFYEMVRDVGVRWMEFLYEASQQPNGQEAIALALAKSSDLVGWFLVGAAIKFFPPDYRETFLKEFLQSTQSDALAALQDAMNKGIDDDASSAHLGDVA